MIEFSSQCPVIVARGGVLIHDLRSERAMTLFKGMLVPSSESIAKLDMVAYEVSDLDFHSAFLMTLEMSDALARSIKWIFMRQGLDQTERLLDVIKHMTDNGLRPLEMSQQTLADLMGTNREQINTCLGKLAKRGDIVKSHRHINLTMR